MKASRPKKNIAVVLIDMQDFFLKNLSEPAREDLIRNQSKVLDLCSQNSIPVITLEYNAGGTSRGETTQKLREKIIGTSIATILKDSNSGFTDTKLDEILKSSDTKEIVLMGVNANGCVQDTAMGALRRGYKVTTCKRVIANSSSDVHGLSMQNEKWFAENTTLFAETEDLIDHL